MNLAHDPRPLVVHVVHRFDTGGLENGVVNLINYMPAETYRHAIVALTEITAFRDRIRHGDVKYIALHKPPGHSLWLYPQLFRLFRKMRPAIVHTRNLAALEATVPAWAAGVPVRIHGEHGRDVGDLDGSNRKYQRLRRLYRPFVTYYLALSRDLAHYLRHEIGIPGGKMTQVYNGVDAQRFRPGEPRPSIPDCPFSQPRHWLVATVGRMQMVKDQLSLVRAFILALEQEPSLASCLRLIMVGEGPLRAEAQALLQAAGVAELAWLPGERSDIAAIMPGLDCFVLPSLAEGISNTILEAMASGLPVIATDVGGNPDLVTQGVTGMLVPAGNPLEMAKCITRLATNPALARRMGHAGRLEVESRFSMAAMVGTYLDTYDALLAKAGVARQH